MEDHLIAHPAIFDAAIVSIPDPALGERTCAFVIPRVKTLKVSEVKAFMRRRGIAEFKVPDQVVFVDAFETTAAGKVSRKELRARLRAGFLGGQEETAS